MTRRENKDNDMGLFTGRHNITAWEHASLFQGKNDPLLLPDIKLYASLTKQQISNDCRIIIDSAEICRFTKERSTLKSRKKLAKERYKHLQTLIPFADSEQKLLIREAKKAMKIIEGVK
jgi:hypothetical protein